MIILGDHDDDIGDDDIDGDNEDDADETPNANLCHVTKFSLYLPLTVLYFYKK